MDTAKECEIKCFGYNVQKWRKNMMKQIMHSTMMLNNIQKNWTAVSGCQLLWAAETVSKSETLSLSQEGCFPDVGGQDSP